MTRNLYIDHGVKHHWTQGRQEACRLEEELKRKLSPILFKLYSKYLTEKSFKGFGDFKMEQQIIITVK